MSRILLLVLPQHFWYNGLLEYKMRRQLKTKEEKFAEILSNWIADLRFDLEFAGRYLAITLSNVSYRRLLIVLEAMKHEREEKSNEYDYTRE
jgi:hypothetical protein